MRFPSPPSVSLSRIRTFTVAVMISVGVSSCTLNSSVPVASAPEPTGTVTALSSTQTRYENSPVEFEHFTVTASRINTDADPVLLEAKVCVRSIPSTYVGKRIRISWDPWSVTAGQKSAGAGYRGKAPANLFRADGDYQVGGCVSGRIPFDVKGDVDTVTYANSTGDTAVWDADALINPPRN